MNETEDTVPLQNTNSLNKLFYLEKKKASFTNTLNTLSLFQKTRSERERMVCIRSNLLPSMTVYLKKKKKKSSCYQKKNTVSQKK